MASRTTDQFLSEKILSEKVQLAELAQIFLHLSIIVEYAFTNCLNYFSSIVVAVSKCTILRAQDESHIKMVDNDAQA